MVVKPLARNNEGNHSLTVFASKPIPYENLGTLDSMSATKYIESNNGVSQSSVHKVLNRHNAEIRKDYGNNWWIGNTSKDGEKLLEEMKWQEKTLFQKVVTALLPNEYTDKERDTTVYKQY